MRVYALILGIALTAGYGYAADLAVASIKPGALKPTAAKSPVWYGGVLEPVTVEVRGGEVRSVKTAGGRVIHRSTLQCSGSEDGSVRTIS